MLKQHFNAIREYAEKMISGTKPEIKHGANFSAEKNSVNSDPISFEQQLNTGLYTPISQLFKNKVGWCYRSVPVVLYWQNEHANKIHFSSDCGELNTQSQHQWLWVKSLESNNADNHVPNVQDEWCSQCLLTAGFPPNHDLNFIDFVKQNSHHYFHEKSLKLWSPGQAITSLICVPAEHDIADDEYEYKKRQCHHCTWQLPEDSPYFISNKRFPALADDGQHYCLLCIQAHAKPVVAIPEAFRWKALQQRYDYFNGICKNWSHLKLHIDISWHPLINALQQKGIEMPQPYHSLYQGQRFIALAPLVWKDKKRAVVMSKEHLEGIDNDWNIITYAELLNSLG